MIDAFVVESLADELKKLIGWGAHPKRLFVLPTLRALAGVGESVEPTTAGHIIQRYLLQSIDSLAGTYEFAGCTVEAEKLKRAYRLLFRFEGTGQYAPNRRARAIDVLRVPFDVQQWRRPYGPEREVLVLLAESMCAKSGQTTA
jgi:hypothetical protein